MSVSEGHSHRVGFACAIARNPEGEEALVTANFDPNNEAALVELVASGDMAVIGRYDEDHIHRALSVLIAHYASVVSDATPDTRQSTLAAIEQELDLLARKVFAFAVAAEEHMRADW